MLKVDMCYGDGGRIWSAALRQRPSRLVELQTPPPPGRQHGGGCACGRCACVQGGSSLDRCCWWSRRPFPAWLGPWGRLCVQPLCAWSRCGVLGLVLLVWVCQGWGGWVPFRVDAVWMRASVSWSWCADDWESDPDTRQYWG